MKNPLIPLLVFVFSATLIQSAEIKFTPDDKKIAITIDGKPFSNYFFADGDGLPYTRPFFSAVMAADGTEITADQVKTQAGKPWREREHPHHRSVWVAHGEVNDADHWSLKEDGSNPKQRHIAFSKTENDGFVQQLEWDNKAGKPILKETRTVKIVTYPDGARAIDLKTELTALEDVEFGDTKEAGMVAVRVVKELSKDENVSLSTGAKGMKASWGKPAKWSDISGTIAGKSHGVAILDHPTNPKSPSRWHIRDYGLNTANIFGESYFDGSHKKGVPGKGALKLAKDKSIAFRYRVIFHASTLDEAKIEEKWVEFAK